VCLLYALVQQPGVVVERAISGSVLEQPGDLRRFLPGSSGTPGEAQLLRALVDVFPACGLVAIAAALTGGLVRGWRRAANVALGLGGLVPLGGWAIGITRLPPGANPEIGLWLIASGSVAVLLGLAVDLTIRAERGR
jgi:hypothetical protein